MLLEERMVGAFFQGFGIAAGLITAIGAQNAFVLSRAVRRNHHVAAAGLCMACDAVLVSLGVFGVGGLAASDPDVSRLVALGGAVFLFWYGLGAFRSMLRGGTLASEGEEETLWKTVCLTLAVTLLNPHVYLDTIVLLGGVSGRFPGEARYVFGCGAVLASVVWFTFLCLFGRILAPVFAKPGAWRVLDGLVWLTMWSISATLAAGAV